MSLKYEPASEPLHISVKYLFSNKGAQRLDDFEVSLHRDAVRTVARRVLTASP